MAAWGSGASRALGPPSPLMALSWERQGCPLADPPDRMWRSTPPAPPHFTTPPPPRRTSHRKLLVHLGLQGGGPERKWGRVPSTRPALGPPPACSPSILSCCRRGWGLWSPWRPPASHSTKSVLPAAPSPSNGLPLPWRHPSWGWVPGRGNKAAKIPGRGGRRLRPRAVGGVTSGEGSLRHATTLSPRGPSWARG